MRQSLFTNTEFQRDNRGLYYTLDAMLFAGLLIVAVVLAINAAPTQGSQDVAADRAEAQLQTNAQDVLAVANSTGRLKETTLYWDDSAGRWVDSGSSERYFKPPSDHPLETPLSKIFEQENIAYNIAVIYQTEDGSTETKRLYYQGTPGAHAVSAQYTTVLNDDTHLRGPDSDRTVSESSTFYAPDAFPESSKYNILQVRMIVWKL
jgi:hypothetical protein